MGSGSRDAHSLDRRDLACGLGLWRRRRRPAATGRAARCPDRRPRCHHRCATAAEPWLRQADPLAQGEQRAVTGYLGRDRPGRVLAVAEHRVPTRQRRSRSRCRRPCETSRAATRSRARRSPSFQTRPSFAVRRIAVHIGFEWSAHRQRSRRHQAFRVPDHRGIGPGHVDPGAIANPSQPTQTVPAIESVSTATARRCRR